MNTHTVIAEQQAAGTRTERRNIAPKSLSLALQGSGTHGAFAWGVIDKLLEDGRITIEAISATGGASFNAVVYSSALVGCGRN